MLDLIFDYPIIFGVIIYFIWTLFRPSKAEKQRQPQNRPQTFDPHEETYYEVEEPYEVQPAAPQPQPSLTQQEPVRPKVTLTQSNSSQTINYALEKERLEERKRKAEQAVRQMNQGATRTPSKPSSSRLYGSLHQRLRSPSKQQLREGILWAEILSKPKAKRQSIK